MTRFSMLLILLALPASAFQAAGPPIANGLAENGVTLPPPPPPALLKLLGEYENDGKKIYLSERAGKLHCLIESTELSEMEAIGRGQFRFPRGSRHGGEEMRMAAKGLSIGKVFYQRLPAPNRNFRVVLQKPIAELKRIAAVSTVPVQPEGLLAPDLVNLRSLSPTIHFDIRYATSNNFMGTALYSRADAWMQRPAAEALLAAHRWLAERGYGLLIHDSYRPWKVTKMFWEATPVQQRNFVANPATGSRHNRGCAVDLSMYSLKTGKAVETVSGYDEFSDRAYPDYPGGTSQQRWLRGLLRKSLEDRGFIVNSDEWWHFDYKDWRKYPVLDLSFETLGSH